jgi:hypothetical protein
LPSPIILELGKFEFEITKLQEKGRLAVIGTIKKAWDCTDEELQILMNQAEIEIKHIRKGILSNEKKEQQRWFMARKNIIGQINLENNYEWKEAVLRERKEWTEKPIEEKIQISDTITIEAET